MLTVVEPYLMELKKAAGRVDSFAPVKPKIISPFALPAIDGKIYHIGVDAEL